MTRKIVFVLNIIIMFQDIVFGTITISRLPIFNRVLENTNNLLTSGVNSGIKIDEVSIGVPPPIKFPPINQTCFVHQSKSELNLIPSELNFVLIGREINVTISLAESEKLWTHDLFNLKYTTVLLITESTSNLTQRENQIIDTVYKAYVSQGNTNYIVLNSSVFNTTEIGCLVGEALVKLVLNYPIEKIYVFGYSLGAHIAGACGRYIKAQTEKLLPCIIGYDPADRCFNENKTVSGLQYGDAEFIDVIYTNNSRLVAPNEYSSVSSGCSSFVLSHARAFNYFAETIAPGRDVRNMPTSLDGAINRKQFFWLQSDGERGTFNSLK